MKGGVRAMETGYQKGGIPDGEPTCMVKEVVSR
jgi:hypothetical protein